MSDSVQRPNEWRPSTRTRVGETQHEAEGQWSGCGGETQVNHRPAPKRVVGGRWSPWKLNSRLVRATSSSPARQSSLRVPSCTHQLDVWRAALLGAVVRFTRAATTCLPVQLRSGGNSARCLFGRRGRWRAAAVSTLVPARLAKLLHVGKSEPPSRPLMKRTIMHSPEQNIARLPCSLPYSSAAI